MTSYKIDELAREASVSPRTVRYYVQRGLLPAPAFHGRDTAYDRGHLLRLQVIKKLQEGHLPLDEIQVRIGAASDKELERMLASGESSPSPRGARGGRIPASDEPHSPSIDSSPPGTRETWDRIHLMDGLELHVRSDAGVEARRAALEIQSQYGQRSSRSS
ncbi:MAG: MerR family transcriptional regulator [Polyangiaceae bacterium]|nr:MerR family transcriptional regulator [Polyangiaceae bacterium]